MQEMERLKILKDFMNKFPALFCCNVWQIALWNKKSQFPIPNSF